MSSNTIFRRFNSRNKLPWNSNVRTFKGSLQNSRPAREGIFAQEFEPMDATPRPFPAHARDLHTLLRTKNSKKSSHMPLAGLCISRGRRDCPDLLRAPTDDRCFALVQADCLAGDDQKGGGDREKNGDEGNDTDGGGGSPAPGRRKWGIGGTLPADLAHGKRWRGGADAGWMGVATAGRLSASSTPGGVAAAAATTGTAANRRANAGARERMGLETASTEECTALVDEINELVRRAGLKHGAGGSSSRGRDLFDEWVMQSAEARRGADADAGAEADVA